MARKQICKEFKHCTQCEHFKENLTEEFEDKVTVEVGDSSIWVKCEKYGVYSPTIIELQTSAYYNRKCQE